VKRLTGTVPVFERNNPVQVANPEPCSSPAQQVVQLIGTVWSVSDTAAIGLNYSLGGTPGLDIDQGVDNRRTRGRRWGCWVVVVGRAGQVVVVGGARHDRGGVWVRALGW